MKSAWYVGVVLATALMLMPAWPAPSTNDDREIIIQTLDSGSVTQYVGCDEGDITVYDTGPEADLVGSDCPTAAYDAAPIVVVIDADQACPYVLINLNEGISVTTYGETNGEPGLQWQDDAGGADQYCTMP